jgi:hypothetical protein
MSILSPTESKQDTSSHSPPVPGATTGVLSAAAFLGLFIFGILLNSVFAKGLYPMPTVPAAETVQYRLDNPGVMRLSGVVNILAGVAAIWYAAWLAAVVGRRSPNGQASWLTFAGGLLSGTFLILSGAMQWVVQRPDVLANEGLTQVVNSLIFVIGGVGVVLGYAGLVGVSSLVLSRAGLIPTWLAAVGVVSGALSLVAAFGLVPEGTELVYLIPLGRFPALIWIGFATGYIIRRRPRLTATA